MSPEAEDPQRHPHAHTHGSDHTADSAGFPWAGRSFEANPFAGDDGSADPALIGAIVILIVVAVFRRPRERRIFSNRR